MSMLRLKCTTDGRFEAVNLKRGTTPLQRSQSPAELIVNSTKMHGVSFERHLSLSSSSSTTGLCRCAKTRDHIRYGASSPCLRW